MNNEYTENDFNNEFEELKVLLSENIKYFMCENNIHYKDFIEGEFLNLARSHWHNILNNKSNPTLKTLLMLSKILNIDIKELFFKR